MASTYFLPFSPPNPPVYAAASHPPAHHPLCTDLDEVEHARDVAADDFDIVCARLVWRLSSLAFSPPPAAVAQDGIIAKQGSLIEAPGSPALSTTSTAELGSSPILPPLPAPTFDGRTLDILKTPPSEPRTSSSRYYTASWGSPYPEASDAALSVASLGDRKSVSSDTSEDSPLRQLELHTPYLRPAPTFSRSQIQPALGTQSGLSAAVLLNRVRRPARGLTEDWIRAHTERDETTERANWLSDSNVDSEDSDQSEDWIEEDFDPKTPTLKSFIGRRGNPRDNSPHIRKRSTDTLKQADFKDDSSDLQGDMAATAESAIVDPLGEMAIARKGSARKHVSHSRAPSTTSNIRPHISSQLDTRDVLRKDGPVNNIPTMATLTEAQDSQPGQSDAHLEGGQPMLDKELPLPPPEKSLDELTESSEWRAALLPAPTGKESGIAVSQTATSPEHVPPRLKKKIPWKGKNITVYIPFDGERGKRGTAPIPMTPTDVDRMLRDWEQLGYNVNGFNIGQIETTNSAEIQGQSKRIWPDSDAISQERQVGEFRVSIPDRREWEAYVVELREAKLRALGVSLGDDDPVPSISSTTMSRQTSVQHGAYPPLPFSPPIPPSSATSSHTHQHPNTFSPALIPGMGPSTSQSSNVGSIASPASMHAQMYGKFNPRQSISIGSGDNSLGSPYQFPQQTSPGVWSPQQMLYQPGLARGGSPSLQNVTATISPVPPFAQETYFQHAEVAAQLQQRQQQLQNQLQHQLNQVSARASPLIQEFHQQNEVDSHKSPSKTPEALHFSRHNASDSLQKEIDDAEYHLEEQFQRQLDHDDYSPHSEKEENVAELRESASKSRAPIVSEMLGVSASHFADTEGTVLHHPQPHSRGHSLSQRPFIDEDIVSPALAAQSQLEEVDTPDVGTDPTTDETPALTADVSQLSHKRSFSSSGNPWADSESSVSGPIKEKRGHASKPSLSKWNVAAPEFKFNPSRAVDSSQSWFASAFSQPSIAVNASLVPSAAPFVPLKNQSSKKRLSVSSKINVDAPVFTPGQTNFNFSSSDLPFRPDAPAFTPKAALLDAAGSGQFGSESFDSHKPIFGKIDMTGLGSLAKTSKMSKAVPIIRPDSANNSKAAEDDMVEDRDGRINQREGRSKRVRCDGNDGDSVPLFAEPSPGPSPPPSLAPNIPLQETTREQSPPKENTAILSTVDDKENLPLRPDRDALRVVPLPVVNALRSRSTLEDSPDYDGKGWAPWEFTQQHQVQDFNIASAFPVDLPNEGKKSEKQEKPERLEREDGLSKQEILEKEDTVEKPEIPEKLEKEAQQENLEKPKKEDELEKQIHETTSDIAKVDVAPPAEPLAEKPKAHKKNALSALAKPFDLTTPSWLKFGYGTSPAKQAPPTIPVRAPAPVPVAASAPVPVIKPSSGLSSSRYANSPSPPLRDGESKSPELSLDTQEKSSFQESLPPLQSPQSYRNEVDVQRDREPTFEEIDAVMRHMNEDPDLSINRDTDTPRWHQQSPIRRVQTPVDSESSPVHFQAQELLRSDAPSPSPRRFQPLPGGRPGQRVFSRVHDDPFVAESLVGMALESPVHNLNSHDNLPTSDWGSVLSESEDTKFQARTQFFDNHVNDLVGGLLAERLDPMERTLEMIQVSLASLSARDTTSRRTRRSFSGELPESDADDEDDEHQRPTSPIKDRKLEKMRNIVKEALVAHQPAPATNLSSSISGAESANVLQVLEEMREQFGQSMRLDLRGEDLRNIVEEAVERRMPATPKPTVDEGAIAKIAELEARISELSNLALKADEKTEVEIKTRRAAEDRLAEVQRLLRISSEEETRLRESLDEKDQKLRSIDDTRSKAMVRTALLEANSQNAHKNHTEMLNKVSTMETDMRQARQEAHRWQVEAEKASATAEGYKIDAESANEAASQMRKGIESLKLQMEESFRVRETMRHKLGGLQEEMAKAAREISQENAQRAKKEQELIARQEVLDARLQAEARTRERLEREIERLENGEREGMRAVSESKRLEELASGLRNELHEAQKSSMRYQREFEEARESGLNEVQRTRHYMQAEIEGANNQVNIVRRDLEEQVSRLRSELDQVRLDADTARARSEMLVEEAIESKRIELDSLSHKHENEIDDLQTRHGRDLGNATEDHQRSEQQLLERLSLSSAKMELLQDRNTHLEERLEIAKAAALAAAQAAKSAGVLSSGAVQKTSQGYTRKSIDLPEKISPQALRESIMVLQEQLQDREQNIERLELKLSTVDLDAPNKISKRDDEITWLRELLAVRIGDLQDIINHASEDDFDPAPVKDAAIRLKANLQMQQQERERAASSASMLPNIAASLKEAASPRVAQVVGPMAAAWGNWRKSQVDAATVTGSTPSKASPQSFLSGLLTPPASSARTPPSQARLVNQSQPTAFGSTGRRFTARELASHPHQSRRAEKTPERVEQLQAIPSTPPMMRKATYDQDALARTTDFGEDGFFDDDVDAGEVGVIGDADDTMFGVGR